MACAMGYRSSAAPPLAEQFTFLALNLACLGLFLPGLRQRHAGDRVLADAAKIEHALMLDYVGDLREALR